MSSGGRFQDALWDLLIGMETSSSGNYEPGLLADLPEERVWKLIDEIADVAYPIAYEAGRGNAAYCEHNQDFAEWDPYFPNSGHGHVHKRPDRVVARCGGPALCSTCRSDLSESQDFGPARSEFPVKEWLLHYFNVYPGDELDDNGNPYKFDGPNGRYTSLRSDVEDDRQRVALLVWNELEERGGWGPNEHLEVHERVWQGGDWRRLTTHELCLLAAEYKPLTYWWEANDAAK